MVRFLMMVAVVMCAGFSAFAAEERFFSNINDLPLMPGLYELTDSALVFDKPEGRIVESAAAGDGMRADSVRGFYAASLPQLGWIQAENGTFHRDGEVLTLRLEQQGAVAVLHVMLAPAGAE